MARPVVGARWRRKARGSAQHPIIRISRQYRYKSRGGGTFLWFDPLVIAVGLVNYLSREAFEISPGDPGSRVHWSAAGGIRTFRVPCLFPAAKKRKMLAFVDASVRANSCCLKDPF